MRFEFATAGRILFGEGTVDEVPGLAADLGRKALVVTGKGPERARPLVEKMEARGIACTLFSVAHEPTTALVQQGTERARESGCDLVVGIGGGSALDAGKAVAALIANGGSPLDYLEVVGLGKPLTRDSVPYIAIPTTAGTGTEVTRNAVLADPEHRVKVSMRSPRMLPRVAVVDPALTWAMPPAVTASTGLDALTQLMEAFVTLKANPLVDGICREGLQRAASSLERAWRDGQDREARVNMSLASLFGGLALANAGLGAVHGFAGTLGGMFPAPHGAICARLLPFVMEANIRALRERSPQSPTLARYDEIARILTGNPSATAEDGIAWTQALCARLGIPPLREVGVTPEEIPAIVRQSRKASSMKGNPVPLTDEELESILVQAL